jgi:hypothetical protein
VKISDSKHDEMAEFLDVEISEFRLQISDWRYDDRQAARRSNLTNLEILDQSEV